MRKKILVVGHQGFIGQHLMRRLKADGIDIKNGNDFLTWSFKRYKTIVFLAANLEFTPEAFKYNYQLYQRLDEYMQRYPRTHIIFTSSSFVYGNNYCANESNSYGVSNAYGQSKIQGEYFVRQYKRYTILRLANVYGNGGHTAIDKFLAGGKTIHGDGLQIRDFVPVEYVVDCIRKVIKKRIYGTYNISSGTGQTIIDIFKQFGTGKHRFDRKADYGLKYIVLNNTKWREKCE